MLYRICVALSLFVYCICGCDKKGSNGNNGSPPPPTDIGWPYSPYNVKAEASANSAKITISWTDNSDNEDGFYLLRFDDKDYRSGKYEKIFTLPADATNFDDVSAQPCMLYRYDVQAFNRRGRSPSSPSNTISLPVYPPTCVATYVSPAEGIRLSITHTFTCVKGYSLFRSVNRGDWKLKENFAPYWWNIITYDTDVQDGTEYCYKVLMYSEIGESSPVMSNCVIPYETITPPETPQCVDITQDDDNNLVVNWDDAGDSEDGFFIYRKVDISTIELWADVPANRTSYTDDQVVPCHTYAYAVSVYNGGGESTKKNSTAFAVPPPLPISVQASFSGLSRGITIDFDDTSTCERGYWLYRSIKNGDFSKLVQLPATDDVHIQYADRAIQTGATYCYAVSVVLPNSQESSHMTMSNCVATQGMVPQASTDFDAACSLADRLVRLSWADRSNDEDGFIIERTYVDGKITRTDLFVLALNITGYDDKSVQSGFDYCYRVAAFNQAGRSSFSSRDCVAVDFVDILTPQDGLVTNTNRISFTAQVLPNISRLSDTIPVLLLSNSQPNTVGMSNNYIFSNILLTPGKNILVLSLSYKNGEIAELPITVTYDPAYVMTGKPILYSALTNAIALTDPVTMQNIGYLDLEFDSYYNLLITPDGKTLYAFRTGFVTIIDTTTNKVADEKPIAIERGAVALSADGERLCLANHRQFVVYDTLTWEVVREYNSLWSGTKVSCCSFNPVTGDLFVGSNGQSGYHVGPVGMFKYPQYDLAYTYRGVADSYVRTVQPSPDGKTVIVASASSGRGNIYAFNAADGGKLYGFATVANFAYSVGFEADGLTYWANDSANYYHVDTATGAMLLTRGRGFSWGLLSAVPNVGFLPSANANGFNQIVRFNLATNETTAIGFITGVPNEPIGFQAMAYQP